MPKPTNLPTDSSLASYSTPPSPTEESIMPESELPPESQPLTLPPDFDPTKYPHYSVQSTIYSLLLNALDLSVRYETRPGGAERQKCLEELILEYQKTCDALAMKASTNK